MTITRNPREAALERVIEWAREAITAMDARAGYSLSHEQLRKALAALDALPAADGGWRPIEEADPQTEYELYFPANEGPRGGRLPAMRKIGRPGDFPFRKSSHFAPLRPPPPVPQSAEEP